MPEMLDIYLYSLFITLHLLDFMYTSALRFLNLLGSL